MTFHAPSAIIAEFMIDEGIFTDPNTSKDWPLFVSFMPDDNALPDDIATIYDTPGVKDGRQMGGQNVLHPGFQVRIRSDIYDDGWEKASEVEEALQAVVRKNVSRDQRSYRLDNLSQASPILFLGLEDGSKRRNLFTINYLATLKEV